MFNSRMVLLAGMIIILLGWPAYYFLNDKPAQAVY
jgi:hypothetical protein